MTPPGPHQGTHVKQPTTTLLALVSALTLISTPALGQGETQEPASRRHFIGSSMFTLANLVSMDDPPSFYQLNYGYHVTPRDVVSLEALTWTYHAPLGIPYGPSRGSTAEAYPGSVREYGVGIAYQRFLWKGLYSAVHALPLLQEYRTPRGSESSAAFSCSLPCALATGWGCSGIATSSSLPSPSPTGRSTPTCLNPSPVWKAGGRTTSFSSRASISASGSEVCVPLVRWRSC